MRPRRVPPVTLSHRRLRTAPPNTQAKWRQIDIMMKRPPTASSSPRPSVPCARRGPGLGRTWQGQRQGEGSGVSDRELDRCPTMRIVHEPNASDPPSLARRDVITSRLLGRTAMTVTVLPIAAAIGMPPAAHSAQTAANRTILVPDIPRDRLARADRRLHCRHRERLPRDGTLGPVGRRSGRQLRSPQRPAVAPLSPDRHPSYVEPSATGRACTCFTTAPAAPATSPPRAPSG